MSTHRKFAEGTKVPTSQSRIEIERLLERYGADQFLYGTEPGLAIVGFRLEGRQIKMHLVMPIGDEKEQRRLWRSLCLAIKSKLECVSSGIETLEDAFMPYVVMPDGTTLGQWARPQIESMYESGEMPPLLAAPKKD